MTQNILAHPHAKSSWFTVRMRVEEMKTVLVVETDLSLNAVSEDYNKDTVDSLLQSIAEFHGANKHIDSADIERIRQAV